MSDLHAPPQPGRPQQANRLLPFGELGMIVLTGAVLCIVATLLFVWLANAALANRFITVDDGIILSLQAAVSPATNQIMRIFTALGAPLTMAVFLALAALALLRAGRWIDALGLAIAGIGGGILNQMLKFGYQRVRPDLFPRSVGATGYSFPSGHAMGSMVCYGALAYVLWRLLRSPLDRGILLLDTMLLVFGIGLSRLFFGVHFPTDVLGGYIAGGIWLVITIIAMRIMEWRVAGRVQGFE